MTDELDAGRAIEILEDDELEQENAAMGEQMDAERAAFVREDRYIVIKRSDLKKTPIYLQVELSLAIEKLAEHLPGRECLVIESDWPEYPVAWQMIEARMTGASLPVGVPDGLFLGDALLMWNRRHDNPPIKVGYEYGVADALLQIMAAPAAPTVKSEQVQCELPVDAANIRHLERCNIDGCWRCENLMYFYQACDECGAWGHNDAGACTCSNKAPSLPAAGSAVESWRDQILRENPKSEPGYWPDALIVAAMGREIEQLRAALSAQQSTPERVSVPSLADIDRYRIELLPEHDAGYVAKAYIEESEPVAEASGFNAVEAVKEIIRLINAKGQPQ